MAQKHVYKLNSLIYLWGGSLLIVLMCPGNTEHGLKARARSKTQLSQISLIFSQKSKIFKHYLTFRYSPTVKYENLDFKNLRFSNICLFNIAQLQTVMIFA